MSRSDFLVTEPALVLYDWLDKRISLAWSMDFRALGRVVDGKLVGVVGYNGFNRASCQMHMAGEGRWINRAFLHRAFLLPFTTWDLQMVIGLVPSGNTAALVIDKKMGFKEFGLIPGAHPDGALHILIMHREECRWIRGKYGEEKRSAGPAGPDTTS